MRDDPSPTRNTAHGRVRRFFSAVRKPAAALLFVVLVGIGTKAWAPPAWQTDNPPIVEWVACTISEVVSFDNRVHVRCTSSHNFGTGATAIFFYAVPTSDTAWAGRFSAMASTAFATGRVLRVQASSADNGSSWGCASSNCRPARQFGMW